MSFRDFQRRKAQENAHNELLAFMLIILGMVALVGGLLATIIVVAEPKWLLIFPYHQPSDPSTFLGLILSLTGFVLMAAGFILVIHYDRRKSWFIDQLEKSSPP